MDILQHAAFEWERFLKESGHWEALKADICALQGPGYVIERKEQGFHVSGKNGQAMLHGVFELMRLLRLGKPVEGRITGSPRFPLRMLWSWSRLDNTYRHSPYMRYPSVLRAEKLGDPEHSPELMRFLRHAAAMGVNALALTFELHHGDLTDLDQHAYRPYYEALESFARYLQEWGIDLYLYTAAAPEKRFCREEVDSDCPFDPRVRRFTEAFIDEVAAAVPHCRGMLVAGGLGGYAGGRLYDCTCAYCAKKTPLQRVQEQISLWAGALARHDMRLVYTVTTDIPFTLQREVEAVLNLSGSLPENVQLTFKNRFHDYEELRYPEHPLFSRMQEEGMPGGQTAVEFQLFPEMRGKGLLLSNVAGVWAEQFAQLAALGAGGVIGVTEPHPDDRHPSMADWYAFGRLCYDERADEETLLQEWAALEYGAECSPVLAGILHDSFRAASDTVYAGGMQCGIHGFICPHPHYNKHKMNDTWCRKDQPLPFGVLGVDDEPLSLYTPQREKEIRADPRLTLLTRAQRVDAHLRALLLAEKEEGIALYASMLARWEAVKGLFAPDDYRYTQLHRMLARNLSDAKRFKACLTLFLDYQAGSLTIQELEKAKKELVGTGEDCSLNTCDSLIEPLLLRLGYLLQGIAYDTHFDNMSDLPQLEGRVWQEGSFEAAR